MKKKPALQTMSYTPEVTPDKCEKNILMKSRKIKMQIQRDRFPISPNPKSSTLFLRDPKFQVLHSLLHTIFGNVCAGFFI